MRRQGIGIGGPAAYLKLHTPLEARSILSKRVSWTHFCSGLDPFRSSCLITTAEVLNFVFPSRFFPPLVSPLLIVRQSWAVLKAMVQPMVKR